MDSIFEVSWEGLEREHVEGFLASASGEGLVWEAKGTAPLTGLKRKIVEGVCGLANQLGGVFIVGAEQAGGSWSLPGVEDNAGEDVHDWIARVLNGNLVNPPPFDVRRWPLGDGRVVAVVRVDPIAVPPCMTRDGLVFLRVVGETLKVKDPRVLAELVRKGQAARDNAEARAVRAVVRLMEAPLFATPDIRVALALAPTGAREDYSSRLFTSSFKAALHVAAGGLEPHLTSAHLREEASPHRDGYVVRRGRVRVNDWAWGIQATWDGTIAVEFATARPGEADRRPPTVDYIVTKAWRAAAEPLAALTGIPDEAHVPTHLAIHTTSGFGLHVEGALVQVPVETGGRPVQRWTTMAQPSQEELDSVVRELARSGGFEAFEPEPEQSERDEPEE
jgi:hypothetical protein